MKQQPHCFESFFSFIYCYLSFSKQPLAVIHYNACAPESQNYPEGSPSRRGKHTTRGSSTTPAYLWRLRLNLLLPGTYYFTFILFCFKLDFSLFCRIRGRQILLFLVLLCTMQKTYHAHTYMKLAISHVQASIKKLNVRLYYNT